MWRCNRGMLRRGKDICFSSGEVVAIETGMALIGVGVASGIVSEIVWLVEGGLCWLRGKVASGLVKGEVGMIVGRLFRGLGGSNWVWRWLEVDKRIVRVRLSR
jgi:hypothetical protein